MPESQTENSVRLIALDWGTSSLRAYLLGDGGVIIADKSMPWGIMAERDFAKALDNAVGDWRNKHPQVLLVAAGMIGSAQGWREIPYTTCPAGRDELAAAINQQIASNVVLPIVPGVAQSGEFPDVMRGEETQIVGALQLKPELFAQSLLVLPGTHSKWVKVENGRITGFTTYLTGELFATLSKHSILGRPAQDAKKDGNSGPVCWEVFDRGVTAIRRNPELGLSPVLFSTRTLVLMRQLAAEHSLDYLSGLLIGEELRCALAKRQQGTMPLALIGENALCERYLRALALFDVGNIVVIPGASAAGLWQIAELAKSS